MEYGLIAKHLGHSFSPAIHGMIGSYGYETVELTEEDLPRFLAAGDFCGVNVTIPYKETVIPYLDRVSDEARRIGAVNTIVRRGGELWGYNTDFGGMTALFHHVGVSTLAGKKVLILGSGGTSRTAFAVAQAMNASSVLRVSRRAQEGCITYDEAYRRHRDAQVVINTTPCGMFPDVDGCPIDPAAFPALACVLDAIFNPLRSSLVLAARRCGAVAEGGLYMLVRQAILASELFTGRTPPPDTQERIYSALLRQKENPVLIGMPSSGKTTVGRLLAERLNRPFVDLDEVIVRQTGCSIREIFQKHGEDGFRRMEADAVRSTAAQTGAVIATGGGCILRRDNVTELLKNGRLYFLDRPLAELLPTKDRPLAQSAGQIQRLYETRLPLYRAAAGVTVPVDAPAEIIAGRIAEDFIL